MADNRYKRQHKADWVAVAIIVMIAIPFALLMFAFGKDINEWMNQAWLAQGGQLVIAKFNVIVGLPAAAIASFLVVVLLRQAVGPIEF